MKAASRSKHIHRLQRANLSKTRKYYVLKCQECPAFFTDSTVIGVVSRCNFCDESFLMNKALLYNSNDDLKKIPHCGCKNKKYKSVSKKLNKKGNLEPAKTEPKVVRKFETLDDLMAKMKKND